MLPTPEQERVRRRPPDAPAEPRPLRLEVQALRALAVLLVVGFHFWPGRVPGGYVGVDVFFVISGFLITSHLTREAASTGRVSLPRFWARRARRLLPAAYLVIAVTAVATLLVVPSVFWAPWFREVLGATLYVENWVLAADAVDYLGADNDPSPVQHYWTLSAEEQFYLLWPLLVGLSAVLAGRSRRSQRGVTFTVLAVATSASFGYSLWLTATNPASAYFVTTTRAWQFGAGALLALLLVGPARRPDARWRTLVSWAGFTSIALCGLAYGASTPFPGTAAVWPVLATAAVIWAGTPRTRLAPAPLIAWRPVQYTGEISYSLYLWHWPAIVLAPFVLGHVPGLLERVTLLAGVFLVSALTKRFVEDPVRFTARWGLPRPRRTLGLTAVGAVILSLVAGSAWFVADQRARDQAAVAARLVEDMPRCFGAASMDAENPCENPDLEGMLVPSLDAVAADWTKLPCFVESDEEDLEECSYGPVDDPDVPHVVVVGDSHTRAMLPAFQALAEQGTISVTPQLKATCAWTTGVMDYDDPQRVATCETWKEQLQEWFEAHAGEIDLIVTTGYARTIGGEPDQKVAEMAAAWRPIADRGVTIVGLSDNPAHPSRPIDCLAELEVVEPDSCAVTVDEAYPYSDPFAATAKAVPGALHLDLRPYYCRDGVCPSVIGGVTVYRDSHHLTTTYTRTMAPYLLRGLRELGALR
ncbi:acyltransferase [Isoptericola sp. 4D.3]|uniref:Acyltransferase n=1 Tax=Isoptericola peretonis TaxID=2918523 RepID=A0ABT0J6A3_9MICO|nr:acyltransferase [Isoptericola sp. 4D.3]